MTAPLVHVEQEVAATADALWAVLADFAYPQRLTPTITDCTISGSGAGVVRRVVNSRGLVIFERLVECDADAHRFVYEVTPEGDMPFPGLTEYRARVSLLPLGSGRTRVSWIAEGLVDGDPAPLIDFLHVLYGQAIARLSVAALEGDQAA